MEIAPASIRNQILREAAHLFVQRGYDGISMREIADACGLSKAGIYYHFIDKEDLFFALLKTNLATLEQLWRDVAADEDEKCRVRLTRFALSLFEKMGSSERAMIRLANQEMSKLSPERREVFSAEYQRTFLQPMANAFEQGMKNGELRRRDPYLLVWVFLGMLYPFFSPTSEVQPETIREAIDVFFDGAVA